MKTSKKLNIWAVLANLVLALILGAAVSLVAPVNALAASAAVFTVGTGVQLLPMINTMHLTGLAYFPLQVTIWQSQLEEQLFPDNTFMERAVDDTPFVMDGKTVIIPQSGANPNVVIDRQNLPAAFSQRTDGENDYTLNELTTDPTLIRDVEAAELSYDKMASILMNHAKSINNSAALRLAYNWTPDGADNQVRTTGSARAAASPGATGNRKAVTRADFVDGLIKLRKQTEAANGFCALVPATMLGDLFKIDDFVHVDKIGEAALKTGIIGRLLGIDLYVRSSGVLFDNAGTPAKKAFGAAAATSDNECVTMWHPDFVRKAKGEVKIYERVDDPLVYGTIMSAGVRFGGKYSRTDKKGVVNIIEAHA